MYIQTYIKCTMKLLIHEVFRGDPNKKACARFFPPLERNKCSLAIPAQGVYSYLNQAD